MGIPSDKAAEFFQYAYDACVFLKKAGFTLHTGSDKEKAYLETFLIDNEEDIFVKQYGPKTTTPANTSLFHSWDTMILPRGEGLASDVGCALQPVWEMIGLYEMPAIFHNSSTLLKVNRFASIVSMNCGIQTRWKLVAVPISSFLA